MVEWAIPSLPRLRADFEDQEIEAEFAEPYAPSPFVSADPPRRVRRPVRVIDGCEGGGSCQH
jgi:hypothetical protein